MLRLATHPPSHEDLFLERYDRLVSAGAALTNGDREAARELVHEAYVQFVVARPRLDGIAHLDGYLFITLRNLHISRVRRSMRAIHEPLALLDFDSAAIGLNTFPAARSLHAADELRWICQYSLRRRPEGRAASAFLLRYFLDHRPSEIALVLHAPIATVHKLLHVARADARAALARSAVSTRAAVPSGSHVPDLQELRQAIFEAPIGSCLPHVRLVSLYTDTAPVDVASLAHIVGCRSCLRRVHAVLGFPPRTDDDPGDSGSSIGGSSASSRREPRTPAECRDTAAVTLEHRPKELRVAVNGLAMGMQRVAGPYNDQLIRLGAHDTVAFVEIFSEQDVRLLLLNADPLTAAGAARQSARVALSGCRELEVVLDLSDLAPTLRVAYRDPFFADIEDLNSLESGDIAGSRDAHLALTHTSATAQAVRQRRSSWFWPPWRIRMARRWRGAPIPLRFALAGVLLGLLLANPSQTLAAVDHMRRVIVETVVQVIDWMRAPAVLPSRSLMWPAEAAPAIAPSRAGAGGTSDPAGAAEEPSGIELSEMALEAFRRLDGAGALTNEQVGVTQGPDRRLHIDGVIESEARRDELIGLLRELPARRVRVALVTFAEAARHTSTATSTVGPLRSATVTRNSEPAGYESMRRYVTAHPTSGATAAGDSTPVDEAVRHLSGALLAQSLQARMHARTVQQLMASVPPDHAERLSSAARNTWRDLVGRHVEASRLQTRSLRDQVELVFPQLHEGRDVPPTTFDRDVLRLADRLFELTSAHDAVARRAFTVTTDGGELLQVSTAAFRRSLFEAEQVAEALLAAMSGAAAP
jgi:DNA-directed RNA polymerase specialized sigma24 family protein